jgi:CHAD domain-containing protein
MSYRLEPAEPVEDGIRRCVREQVEEAIAEIDDRDLSRFEAIHQVRKRCKKVRSVVRLVRPEFDDYRFENAFFRDTARELAGPRDAAVMVDTYDALAGASSGEPAARPLAPLRERLVQRREEVAQDEGDRAEELKKVRVQLHESLERIAGWRLGADGFAAIEAGLLKTYDRGREALALAYDRPNAESFHDWRKRAKYYRYQIRLLRNLWPQVLQALRGEVKALSDLLGEDHDLAVLRQTLLGGPETFGREQDLEPVLCSIDRRSTELRNEARPLGQRIFAEKPKRLGKRLRAYWMVSRAA